MTHEKNNAHDPTWWQGWRGRVVAFAIFAALYAAALWVLDRSDAKIEAAETEAEMDTAIGFMDAALHTVAIRLKLVCAAVLTFIPVDILLLPWVNVEDAFDDHYPDTLRVAILVSWTALFLGFLWFFGQG